MNKILIYFLFNIFLIVVFTFIYYYFRESFSDTMGKLPKLIDYLGLSTTVQSTVGLSDILPKTNKAKLLVMLQQLLTIGGFSILLLYIREILIEVY